MTTFPRKQSNPFTLDADGDYELGDVGAGRVGKVAIMLVDSSCDGTVTVKGRVKGSGAAYVAIPYRKFHLNGSVGDGTVVSTGITDTSIIEVEAGVDVCLTMASRTTGSMSVTVQKLQQ